RHDVLHGRMPRYVQVAVQSMPEESVIESLSQELMDNGMGKPTIGDLLGDPHVLRAQSLVAAAGIEVDGLALAQLLEDRAVPDSAPVHEVLLAVLALNEPEALIRDHL